MQKLFALVAVFSLTLSLTSCGGGIDDPKAFYEDALKKATEMTSYESTIKLIGKITSSTENKVINIDTTINNKTDISNPTDIKSDLGINLNLKGNLTDTKEESMSGKFGIRAINKVLYLRIDDMQVTQDSPMSMYSSMLNLIKGKWLQIPTESSASDPTSSITTMLADKENSMFSIINKIFKYKEYKGEKNSLHEMAIELDKNALINWIESENQKNGGKAMSAEEKTSIENSLKSLSVDAIISIDNNKNIKATNIVINGNNLEDGVSITLTMNSTISNINSAVNIIAPSPNDIVDLGSMMGGYSTPDIDTDTGETNIDTNSTNTDATAPIPNNNPMEDIFSEPNNPTPTTPNTDNPTPTKPD